MQAKQVAFVGFLLSITACADKAEEVETVDTGVVPIEPPPETTTGYVPVDDPAITFLQWTCTDGLPTWIVDLEGRASNAALTLARTSDAKGWEERHSFGEPDYDEKTALWSWYYQLEVTDDIMSQISDQSTLLDCSTGDASQSWGWTMMLTVYNVSDVAVQCVVGGHNTTYFMNYSCAEISW